MRIPRVAWWLCVWGLLGDGLPAAAQAPPALTIDEAVAAALKNNRKVQESSLDVHRAAESTASIRTQGLPQFNLYMLGGASLRELQFTIPRGVLGVYPNVGPIPADTSTITSPRGFNALFVSQAAQPLTQLWKVHLGVMESKLGEDLARERLRQQQIETAHSVRDLYYQIAQTQTQMEGAEANQKYLVDLQAETDRNVAEQSALKADSLAVRAKLSQQRYQLLTLRDALATRKEALNQLLGRDLETDFLVEPQPLPDAAEADIAAARQEALSQRAEMRQARLQSRRAELEVRRERAQYIPDVSAHFTYLALPNVAFVPQNILQAGLMVQWQPFDWGQKRHQTEGLRDSVKQAALTERDAQEQITQDVNARFRSLAEARALLDVTAAAQEAEREKMRVTTNRYAQKAALLSDVLQQEAALTQANGDREKALAAFWSAKAAFDAALGRQ